LRHDDDLIALFVGGSYVPLLTIVVSQSVAPTQSSSFSLPTNELGLAPEAQNGMRFGSFFPFVAPLAFSQLV
jgi:hypothetical protein